MKGSVRATTLVFRSIVLLLSVFVCPLVHAATTTYAYDALGRLVQVEGSANGSAVTYTYDAAGNRIQTTSKSESIPPAVPIGLTATAVSPTQINLSWSAATDNGGAGVVGYRVYRNGSQIGTTSSTSYADASLVNATTYTYQVAAYDAAGNQSAQSASASATTPDGTPPSVPANLTGSAASGTQINLSWSASTDNVGVAGYRLYRGGAHIASSAGTAYSDTTVVSGGSYSYTVAAYDAAGNLSGQSAARNVTTPDDVPPSNPAGLSATTASPSRINLSWSGSSDTGGSGLAGYRVYRNGSLIATPAATSLADTGLSPSTGYSYSVAAYDNASNSSGQSNAASATTWAAVTASLSASSWRWVKRNTNPTQIDPPVTCSGSGGSGSGYTYAWQWVSGDSQTTAVSPASSSTSWTRSVPNTQATYTSVWRCLVTDSSGNTGQNTVTVEFVRHTTQ
ncbi:fibronectin type III domain-containing protein [Povalibacter sp.]|uniref:fibronectin type III domain-containing protein n=1 Tax=Povalibacter sp. TaxID=1962978 RepID=UPI002F3FEAC1